MYVHVYASMWSYMHVYADQTPAETDAVAKMKLKVTVLDDDLNYVTNEIPYVSPSVCDMPDNIHFLSAYGHKTMCQIEPLRLFVPLSLNIPCRLQLTMKTHSRVPGWNIGNKIRYNAKPWTRLQLLDRLT